MLILNHPWESQPQDQREVDWGNPLSQGLVAASIAEGSPNDPTIYTAPNGFTRTIGAAGREAFTTIASTQYFENTGSNRVLGFPFTSISVIRPTALATQAIFTAYTSGTEYHELYLTNAGALVLASAVAGTAAATTAAGVYAAGETFVLGGRVSSATERSVWKNGVQLATNAVSKSPTSAVTNRWGLWNGTTERFGGGFALRLLWNRALSDLEMVSIGKNPWQVFTPTSIHIPLSVLGGGAYTLNLETGVYSFTGSAATLTKDSKLTLESGTYTLSGSNASLLKGLILEASSGSYSLSGSDASLFYTHLLNASSGSYSVTGSDATLTYTPTSGAYTLNAGSGAYVLTGSDVTFSYSGGTITLKAGSWLRYRIIT